MNINYHLINGWTHSHLHTRMQTLNSMITRSVPEYGTQYAKNFVFFIVEQPFFALFLSLSLTYTQIFYFCWSPCATANRVIAHCSMDEAPHAFALSTCTLDFIQYSLYSFFSSSSSFSVLFHECHFNSVLFLNVSIG